MFSQAWHVTQKNISIVLVVGLLGACADLIVDIFDTILVPLLINVFVWSYLAVVTHYAVIEERYGFGAVSNYNAYFRYVFCFYLAWIIIIIMAAIPTLLLTFPAIILGLEIFALVGLVLLMIVVTPIVFIVFSLIGVWFPAIALDRDRSFRLALRRGRQTFFWTLGRLIVGPGLFALLEILAELIPVLLFGLDFGSLGDSVFNPFAQVLMLSLNFLAAFSAILFAVVLSNAYLRAVHFEDGTIG